MIRSAVNTAIILLSFYLVGSLAMAIRQEGPNNYDFLLPMNEPGLALAPAHEKPAKHSFGETKDRIADAVYRILFDASNGEGYDTLRLNKRSDDVFYGQKRQSLRKSNFDLLAGGGLGR